MSDLPDIAVRIRVDDSTVAEVMGRVGQQAETMGQNMRKSAELGRLGFWNLGEAAETTAQRMGIPTQAARQLGNTVEGLAGRYGKFTAVLGGAGLALTAGIAIMNHYREAQRQAREEKIKLGQELIREVTAMDKSWAASDRLREIELKRYQIKRDMTLIALPESIKAMKGELKELHEKYTASSKMNVGLLDLIKGQNHLNDVEKKHVDYLNQMKLKYADIQEAEERLRMLREKPTMNTVKAPEQLGPEFGPSWKDYERLAQARQKDLQSEADYLSAYKDLRAAQGAGDAELLDVQLAMFDKQTAAKLATLYDEAEQRDYLAVRDMQRTTMVTEWEDKESKRRRQIMQMAMQSAQGTLSSLEQMFSLLYQKGGNRARKYFSMYKIAAIGSTIISTANAAMAAMSSPAMGGLGPIAGAPVAAAVTALGALKVQLIRRQQFDAGGGDNDTGGTQSLGAGAGTGVYSVSPTTGLPFSPWERPGGVTLIINGKETNVKDIMTQGLSVLYDSNGTLGGLNVGVTRST